MTEIAKVMKAMDADIVNLVEVENIKALTMFNAGHLDDMQYAQHLKKGRDTYTGQDVAMLTRIDPTAPLDRFDRKGVSSAVQKNVSKNYYTIFEEANLKFAVIGFHFLSGPDRKDRIDDRQAQAASMAYLADELMRKGYEVIMLGDFNDFDGDFPDVAGNKPITKVLQICKLRLDDDSENDLVNVAKLVPQEKRYTSHYDRDRDDDVDGVNELSMIDHILVSKKLADRIVSVDILHQHDPTKVSDHFPVVVTFSTD